MQLYKQVFFIEMGGIVDAGGQNAATFDFQHDTWIFNEIRIYLDTDLAFYYIDGVEIVSWVWSTGAFGQNDLNQLGGINFFAGSDMQPPKYYIDDFDIVDNNFYFHPSGGFGLFKLNLNINNNPEFLYSYGGARSKEKVMFLSLGTIFNF